MKKMALMLPLFFTANLAFAAGGPIPGVNVSLEQIPGGVYHTQGDCLNQGGQIMHERGKTYCVMKRRSGFGNTDNASGTRPVKKCITCDLPKPPPPPSDSTYTKQ